MEKRSLPIDSLVLEHEFYPRRDDDWVTVARYKDAMLAGEEFPPAYVVPYDTTDTFLVIDGWHRVQAAKSAFASDSTSIKMPCIIDADLPRNRWLAVAIEMNIKNARPLTMMDRMMCADRLMKMRWPQSKIAAILHIPLPNLKSLLAKHVVEGGILKSGVASQSGTRQQARAISAQGPIHSRSVYAAMDNFIGFLEAGMVDLSDPIIAPKFKTITDLMQQIAKKKKAS